MKQYERMYNQAPIWVVQILNAEGVGRRRKSITADFAKLMTHMQIAAENSVLLPIVLPPASY